MHNSLDICIYFLVYQLACKVGWPDLWLQPSVREEDKAHFSSVVVNLEPGQNLHKALLEFPKHLLKGVLGIK